MTWTYNSSAVGSSDLSTVRLLIGDNSSSDPLLQDEEINYFLSVEAGTNYAAASACEAIASSFARKVDKTVGNLSISASQKSKQYADMARSLRHRANLRAAANVYAGGISVSDKNTVTADSDRVAPAFTMDMHDYSGALSSTEY